MVKIKDIAQTINRNEQISIDSLSDNEKIIFDNLERRVRIFYKKYLPCGWGNNTNTSIKINKTEANVLSKLGVDHVKTEKKGEYFLYRDIEYILSQKSD